MRTVATISKEEDQFTKQVDLLTRKSLIEPAPPTFVDEPIIISLIGWVDGNREEEVEPVAVGRCRPKLLRPV